MAGVGVIDVEQELSGLRTMVTDLIARVAQMNQDISGLFAELDNGVYGDTYATDRGPAVRASFFERLERANDEHERRTSMLNDQVIGVEATMPTVAGIQTGYHESVDRLIATTTKLENDMKEVSGRVGASHSSAKPGTTGRLSVTGMKGVRETKGLHG